MSVKKLLTDEIESQIGSLEDLAFGSEEYHRGVEDTAKLLDRLNEMEKNERDYHDKLDNRDNERDLKLKEMKAERNERILKYGLNALTFAISLGVTIWANKDSKNFEQGFTHTTEAGRSSTRKLLNLLDKFK